MIYKKYINLAKIICINNTIHIYEKLQSDEFDSNLYHDIRINYSQNINFYFTQIKAISIPFVKFNNSYDEYIDIKNITNNDLYELKYYDSDIVVKKSLFLFWKKTIYIKNRIYEYKDEFIEKYSNDVNIECSANNLILYLK